MTTQGTEAPLWLTMRIRWSFAAIGALLMPWAFPSTGFGWLSIPALASLSLAVFRAPWRLALAQGMLFGFGWSIISLRWAEVISPVAWIGLSAIVAVWTGVFAFVAAVATRHRGWTAVLPTAWVAVEQLRCLVPWGGFPWLRLGFVGGLDPILPSAWLVSTSGVSWFVAALGAAVAYLIINGAKVRSMVPVAVVVLVVSGATVGSLWVQDAGPSRTVAIGYVQPGQTPREIADRTQRGDLLNDTLTGMAIARQQVAQIRQGSPNLPVVIALAEDGLPGTVWTSSKDNERFSAGVAQANASFLAGFSLWTANGENLVNRSALWEPQAPDTTGQRQFYDKRHLVPFGEWVPFRSLTESWVSAIALVPVDFVSGDRPGRFLTASGVSVGTVICFETAYDDVTRDVMHSDVLTVQTNNSAFLNTEQPTQQFEISKARAAEAGRPLVVAAATGVSGVVDARGRVVPGTVTAGNTLNSVVIPVTAGGYLSPAFVTGPIIRWGSVAVTAMLILVWLGIPLSLHRRGAAPESDGGIVDDI